MLKFAPVFLFLGLFLVPASAQTTTGTISGRVVDQSGSVLIGAEVTVINPATTLTRSVFSNGSGNYSFPELPVVGEYRVEAVFEGFKKYCVTGVRVEANRATRMDLPLSPGDVTQVVEVVAEPPLIHEEPAVGGFISGPTILRLPINGRLAELLAQLFPGVFYSVPGSHLYSRGGFNGVGLDEHYALHLLDNNDNGDPVIRSFVLRPSLEQIHEFKLIQAGGSAEFGRSAGPVISITTKSGTNDLHFSMWEFIRNDNLDARNYFALSDAPKPPLNRNQYGGTLSGAIVPNKTFFYGSYEGLRLKQGLSRLATVPTERMRSGDLGQLDGPIVSPTEFDPLAMEVLQAFPLPNRSGIRGNRSETDNRIENANDFSIRVDHRLLKNTWIFGRVSSSVGEVFDPFRNEGGGGSNLAGFGQTADRTRISGGFSAITAGRKFVNELRVGYNRVQQPLTPVNKGTPGQKPFMGFEKAFLSFRIRGFDTLGSGSESKRAVNVYNYSDTVSISAGNHQLKAGIDVRRYLLNSYSVPPNTFVFEPSATDLALANFLRGLPVATLSYGGSPGGNVSKTELAWFVQDDWKATPRLTLNYGLRWEYYGRILEKTNKQSLWVAECNCMQVAGAGLPAQLVDNDLNNFAPRVGLVFRPFGHSKTVLRASGGIYYDNDMRHNTEVVSNPPFFLANQFAASQIPGLSLRDPFPTDSGVPTLTPVTLDRHYRDTYAEVWTLGVQHEIRSRTLVELTYVGNHVLKARRLRNLNQFINGAFPYPKFAAIYAFEQAGNSNSNSLQARVERRFFKGLGFMSSYTWSHAIDDRPGQGGAFVQDNNNIRAERADADFDVRHRLAVSGVWDLPVGNARRWGTQLKGLPQALLGGWSLSAISIAESGRPLNVTVRNPLGSGDRPDAVPGVNWKPSDQTPDHWLNPAAFSAPTPGTFGNLGRNSARGPGLHNVDVALAKTEHFGDDLRLQFRAEFFNVLNHPNFAPPNAQLDSATTFGVISSTVLSERQIQFGIRLEY